jgi:hypothetical protein
MNASSIDRELLRAQLRDMSDAELLRYGKTAREMCSPAANSGKAPRQIFVIQLEEVQAEWKRRHPSTR